MSRRLLELVRGGREDATPTAPPVRREVGPLVEPAPADARGTLERELHRELVSTLDLAAVASGVPSELRERLRGRLAALLEERRALLSPDERAATIEAVLDEVLGLGPLERLLHVPGVTDILVNGPGTVYVEIGGRLQLTDVKFRDEEHLRHILTRVVGRVGRRIDETNPMVDARLPDGSRVHAVLPPVALRGATLSIRRFGAQPLEAADLVRLGTVPAPLLDLLSGCVRAKLNVLVSGGTGSGKTTLLNVLSAAIPDTERVVTIEDAAELRLQQRHVVALETRPPNLEGQGEITARTLVRNALRMRPDRVILGEIRSDEALDMLQAMNTGHEGSLGTIHANGPRHALGRLETLVALTLPSAPTLAIREMIANALHLVVQVQRGVDGRRRIVAAEEVLGLEDGALRTRPVFTFEQTSVDAAGRVRGRFVSTAEPPAFLERFRAHGLTPPAEALGLVVEA